MGIFNGESKEEKQARKAQELMEKYGLTGFDPEYQKAIWEIGNNLAGNTLIEVGSVLSGGSAVDSAKMTYLHALVNQNWIIIRELDAIRKSLEK